VIRNEADDSNISVPIAEECTEQLTWHSVLPPTFQNWLLSKRYFGDHVGSGRNLKDLHLGLL